MDAAAIAKTQSEYVKVTREELLTKVKENAEKHSKEWEEAHKQWRIDQIEYMKEYAVAIRDGLDNIESGGDIKWLNQRDYQLEEPISHSKQYERVSQRLEMSIDDHIFLSHKDFDRFVMDDWDWKGAFTASVANYSNKR